MTRSTPRMIPKTTHRTPRPTAVTTLPKSWPAFVRNDACSDAATGRNSREASIGIRVSATSSETASEKVTVRA